MQQLFVDNLTVIDCSYLHPEFGVEGESWICDVVLTGKLDEQSMIMDFGHVKKQLKRAIDESVDHALLIPMNASSLALVELEESVTLTWCFGEGVRLEHRSPEQALCRIEANLITAQSVQQYLEHHLMDVVQETVEAIEITLRPEKIDGPYYHYSHGLKKHDGNCQRIAHGHRSKIEVYKNGALDEASMQNIAEVWKHIYVVSEGDITNRFVQDGCAMLTSSYVSDQGAFSLSLPESCCTIIPCDSTVECIASYWLKRLQAEMPDASLLVKAYEGVQKGAIARS